MLVPLDVQQYLLFVIENPRYTASIDVDIEFLFHYLDYLLLRRFGVLLLVLDQKLLLVQANARPLDLLFFISRAFLELLRHNQKRVKTGRPKVYPYKPKY